MPVHAAMCGPGITSMILNRKDIENLLNITDKQTRTLLEDRLTRFAPNE